MARLIAKDIERFFSKVDKTDTCWLWKAGKSGGIRTDPYGYFWYKGSMIRAHRFSWLIHYGIIEDGKLVLHRCDIPSCVNPNHLFLGSNSDNLQDAYNKGRMSRKGEKASRAVLNSAQVLEIRKQYETGEYTLSRLATEYGVHPVSIRDIVNRKSWKHL